MGFYKPAGDLSGVAAPQNPRPAQKLANYAGKYANAYFNAGSVEVEGDRLVLVLGPHQMKFPLTHWDGDTFAVSPGGENAPAGSMSSVKFQRHDGRREMTVEYLNANGLGRFSQ
jgi:hypothetical protein